MKPQNTRPETTKNSRIDRNLVFSPEPQKLYQPLHQTPKPIISSGQSPEKYPPIPFSNPEVLEKELVIPIKPPHFIQFLPFEVFERKFELAIKNKQNKGILPSRKIDIYLNKESLSQNDFYAVKTFECESLDQISRKIQSLMISNHLMNNNDISLKILYYTIDASDKKTKKINFTFILIMELAESNLADEFLRRKAKKTQFSKLEMYTLTEALIILLAKMEKLKIAHGNLKPENVLLVKGRYKFTDFNGTFYERMDFYLPSQHVIATKYIPQGVREKMTEKIIFDINYYKLDVFSLGAMLLECADGEEIEENGGFTEEKIQEKINKVAGRYDSWFINLLQNMLENEENNRVDIDGVCEQIAKYHEVFIFYYIFHKKM